MTTWEFYLRYDAEKHKDALEIMAGDFCRFLESDWDIQLTDVQEGQISSAMLEWFECRKVKQ